MKPVILIFAPVYLPGFRGGGPIRTIANLADQLGDEFEFRIVTSDRDMGDQIPYPNVMIDQWNKVGKAFVFYASKPMLSLKGIFDLLRETRYDALYLNSFFNVRFTLFPVILRRFGVVSRRIPLIIAPRGEFSKGALSQKPSKKKVFLFAVQLFRFFSDVRWQASTETEATDIRSVLKLPANGMVQVARNLVGIEPVDTVQASAPDGYQVHDQRLRICFLARISPMKNLDFALGIICNMRTKVQFDIYGPVEDVEYWERCQRIIAAKPPNVKIEYYGEVDNPRVKSIISTYDVFFVPSLGENFGHIYMEAFCAGTPVLVSDRTPWRNLEGVGVGWDIPLDSPDRFLEVLHDFSESEREYRMQLRLNCKEFARVNAADPTAVCQNRALFKIKVA